MAQWISFVLIAAATVVVLAESRAIPAEPMMLDAYGNPVVFLREKRTAVQPYPHRAMMFTSYYRPVRRSSQATGVFAQGNAVSGEAFFGGVQTPHLKNGPEPIEESEVSSAEAHAAPAPDDSYTEEEQQPQVPPQEEEYQPEEPQEQHPLEGEQQNKHHDAVAPQEQPEAEAEPEPAPVPAFSTEAVPVAPAEEPAYASTETPVNRPKVSHGKKTKKTPVVADDDDEEYDEEDDEELSVPFVPFKGNRRRQNYPNLNNFFPMVFSFPGGSTRAGSSGGSPPGAVTAIANSYSTGKGGVASSVATAYGGSPNGKKRRTQPSEE